LQFVAGLAEYAGDGLGAGGQGRAAQQHGGDALAAPVGGVLLEPEDGAAGGGAAGPIDEAGGAVGFKFTFPGVQGMLGDADQGGEVAGGQAAAAPGVEDEEALLGGQRRGG